MNDDVILKEWPEINRALIEKRYEISLTSIEVNKRKPDINDERVQEKIFHSVITLLHYFDE